MGASAAKIIYKSTEKRRCARVSRWVSYIEMLKSGFLQKIGVWEHLTLRRKHRFMAEAP